MPTAIPTRIRSAASTYNPIQFMEHIKTCKKVVNAQEKSSELVYEKVLDNIIKVPIDASMTKFKW